jgi:chitinase
VTDFSFIPNLLLSLLFLLPFCAAIASARDEAGPEAVIAYVFVMDRTLEASEIAAEKLTRINYAFANLRKGEMVEGFPHDADNFATLNSLKSRNPHLRLLVSVGGWTWSGGFSDMARTPETRRKFIASAVAFLGKYRLDGIDIDWEYPGLPGIGNPFRAEDRENYTALLKELRQQLDIQEKLWKRPLITSIAAGASAEFLEHTQMVLVSRYVNTVNLMSYDYYESSSSSITGHHAPLFTNPADPKEVSADASVRAFLAAGVPAHKLVLGVPFYGHAWSEVGPASNGLFQPGKPASIQANYHDITGSLLNAGYVRYWDKVSWAPFLYNPVTRRFVSYEDPESVGLKARYVLQRKLGGIMFWEYHGDANGALLNAINAVFDQPRPHATP